MDGDYSQADGKRTSDAHDRLVKEGESQPACAPQPSHNCGVCCVILFR